MDINSGGAVFFCVFDGGANEGETVAVVKFCANRLAAQSEYFAYEIANSLGVVAPTTRLFRKAAGRGVENTPPAAMGDVPGAPVPPADGREWSAALDAARRLSFPVTFPRTGASRYGSGRSRDCRSRYRRSRSRGCRRRGGARAVPGGQPGGFSHALRPG